MAHDSNKTNTSYAEYDFSKLTINEERYEKFFKLMHIFCKIRNNKSLQNKSQLIEEAKRLFDYIKESCDEDLKNSILQKLFGGSDNEPYAETLLYDGTKEQCPTNKGKPDDYAKFLQNVVKVKEQNLTINDDGLVDGDHDSFDSEIVDLCRNYANSKLHYNYFDTFHQRVTQEPDLLNTFLSIAKKTFKTGNIPKEFLQSRTYKVPKGEKHKGSTDNNCYRPLVTFDFKSLLLQRIVLEFLIKQTKGKVKGLQFAYREHYDRELNILALHQHIKKLKNEKRNYAVLFYDVTKAFNNVNHQLLLAKLKKLNIERGLFNWIKTFLTSQETRVCISKTLSEPFTPNGIPQGSPIGPWLFVIYMNDVFDLFNENEYDKMFLYADDMTVVISDPSTQKINAIHKKIENWLNNEASMEINLDKLNYYLRTFDASENAYVDSCLGRLHCNSFDKSKDILVGFVGVQELIECETDGFGKHVDKLVGKMDVFKGACQALKDVLPNEIETYKMFIKSRDFQSQILLWGIDQKNREKCQQGIDQVLKELGKILLDNQNLLEDKPYLRRLFDIDDVDTLYKKKASEVVFTINNLLKDNKTLVGIFSNPVPESAYDIAIKCSNHKDSKNEEPTNSFKRLVLK